MLERRNINRMSSIESEPMTLTMDQIDFAREAALYVLQTKSMEEAMNIFTEGLEPVISAVDDRNNDFELMEEHQHLEKHELIRDVVTAPF